VGSIVAIGGGELKDLETLAIDRRVVERTGVARPNVLFIPTASSDDERYVETVRKVYGGRLGCEIEVLRLIAETPMPDPIAALIADADLVYVGGGNTLKMMRRWRRLGVDRLLVDAYRRGTVLSGLSAGALCWFAYGHSDSLSFYHPDHWDYIRVRCLGLVSGTCCPHYDGERRDPSFHRLIERTGDIGIALDDCCALEIVDGSFKVLTSREGAGAYRVTRRHGTVRQESIPQRSVYSPLAEIFDSPPDVW
jgi:dipeptidase E